MTKCCPCLLGALPGCGGLVAVSPGPSCGGPLGRPSGRTYTVYQAANCRLGPRTRAGTLPTGTRPCRAPRCAAAARSPDGGSGAGRGGAGCAAPACRTRAPETRGVAGCRGKATRVWRPPAGGCTAPPRTPACCQSYPHPTIATRLSAASAGPPGPPPSTPLVGPNRGVKAGGGVRGTVDGWPPSLLTALREIDAAGGSACRHFAWGKTRERPARGHPGCGHSASAPSTQQQHPAASSQQPAASSQGA